MHGGIALCFLEWAGPHQRAVVAKWMGIHDGEGAAEFAKMSMPEQKCIGWPEQKYISDAGKKAPELGVFQHQVWVGLCASVSEPARRELRLL